MSKFWKWMKKKKYAFERYKNIYYLYDKKKGETIPTKKMIIGYMMEYLYEQGDLSQNAEAFYKDYMQVINVLSKGGLKCQEK